MKKIYIEPTCFSHKFVTKTNMLQTSNVIIPIGGDGDNGSEVLGKKGMWDAMEEDED